MNDTGSRVVERKPGRVRIVQPWKAGECDPPMQEWLLWAGNASDEEPAP